ncbi:MAG: TonB-dependent receptor [Verrucomicrobiota bacterium]|nr:TonB-dependent receptor [Limisphaera sp.]MDW8382030.1 TonB-dependent receptor [Verrucomicrobiota bacterium]
MADTNEASPSPHEKALRINLDARWYGTFAEIGAGQEVARWFFRVGGASGTVAKTISAYDMAVSDAVYGPTPRYVSRQRLEAMLKHEFDLVVERLDRLKGAERNFFAFADTVATRSYSRPQEGHGWVGIRFQHAPRQAPSDVILHVRLLDKEPVRQQEALGILGVNLLFGTFYLRERPERLIRSLLDHLTWERIEVDLIDFAGPAFAHVDNRLMALQLVEQDLTEAAMFTASGEPVQWAEVLYKRPVLVQRGSFRPYTNAALDVLERAHDRFTQEPELQGESPVVVLEMTLRHLTTGDAVDHLDFLQRADMLRALGKPILISNFRRFHRLASYLSRYTTKPIALAMGASKLFEIFDESFYNRDEGGLLGGLGQLFKNPGRLYVYPSLDLKTGQILAVDNFPVATHLRHLYEHLKANRFLVGLIPTDSAFVRIRRTEVLTMLQQGCPDWEAYVPPPVAAVIKRDRLFGYQPAGGPYPGPLARANPQPDVSSGTCG